MNRDIKTISEAYIQEIALSPFVKTNGDKENLDRKDKEKKEYKFDPINPKAEGGYVKDQDDETQMRKSLEDIRNDTFAMKLPGLDEINEFLTDRNLFVSYDGNVYKLLKVFDNDDYKEMGNFNDAHELMRYVRQIQYV